MKKILLFIPLALSFNFVSAQNVESQDSVYKCITITVEDFNSLLKSGKEVKIIDVRLPAEFRPERIEHAINIPVLKISAKKTRKLDKESVFVLYCVSGVRSCKAAVKFHELGFKNIYSLEGGIRGWKAKGLPVVKKRRAGEGESGRGK